jgi:tRNA G18 (ribose-2'-O)-methylase SpoU
MPRIPIHDLDDPRLAIFRNLKATNATRGLAQFVLEGEKLLRRLLESRFPVASVLTSDRAADRIASLLAPDMPHYIVAHPEISQVVGYNFHLGVVSCADRRDWPPLEIMLPPPDRPATLAVLPHVDNPENLGALLRIGRAFGLDAVLAGDRSPDPLSRRVLRVSMGAALEIPVYPLADRDTTLEHLAALGFQAVAAVSDPEEAIPLDAFRRPPRLAMLLGNESHGLDAAWLESCPARITIPMRPGADSVNLAVAAGILLYHLGIAGHP